MPLYLIILLSFFSMSFAHAAVPPFPKSISCFQKVTTLLDKLGTVDKWLAFPQGVGGKIPAFGNVEIHQVKKGTMLFARTDKSITKFYWAEPKCEEVVTKSEVKAQGFTDLDFAQLLLDNPKGGLIYIWSPHMSLSVGEVTSLSSLKLPAPFKVILDPKANTELAEKVVKNNKLPADYLQKLDSVALHEADITIHYPSVVFYKDGKILKRVPGYNGPKLIDLTKKTLK